MTQDLGRLVGHVARAERAYASKARRGLHGEKCDGGASDGARCLECAEIGGDSGAAAGVEAADRQGAGKASELLVQRTRAF